MGHFCSHCVTPVERARAGESDVGMFGRLFPDLPPLRLDPESDLALGRAGGLMDATSTHRGDEDNPRIPAGWTFFGQIVAHDVTHDRVPLSDRETSPRNYRTPRLDLEVLYGAGPVGQPFLYQQHDSDKFLIGKNDLGEPRDLPRNPEGLALIGDPRNDTYLFISQLHLALLKLHNLLVDEVRADGTPPSEVFSAGQALTRWHYQWIVLHHYLPLTVGEDRVDELMTAPSHVFRPADKPFVPVEFSAAAYRFGHSQVRSRYDVNDSVHGVPIFPDLVGQQPVNAALRPDWSLYFEANGSKPLPSKRVDTAYAGALQHLPAQLTGELQQPEHAALAYRDLQRGSALDLPSGENVARVMGERPLSRAELGLPSGMCPHGTPLCFYILREAEVQTGGTHLGRVGGRLIAEVIIGLLRADPTSYLTAHPGWKPTLSNKGDFTIVDMLAAADALPAAGQGASHP